MWLLRKIVLPLPLQVGQVAANLRAGQRIEAVGRLVEDEQLRVVQHRLGQAQPLEHALGIGPHGILGPLGQADLFQQLARVAGE